MILSPAALDLLALIAAIPLAALGGEAFLKGVLGLSTWLRVPNFLIATTLAAFATSSPEFTVSTMAALAGQPEIGLGDALGSNVVNLGLVLGLALLFGALAADLREIRRDLTLAVAVPILTLLLALDGTLSRLDGALLLGLFAFWLVLVVRQALTHRRVCVAAAPVPGAVLPIRPARAWALLAVGLASLILAGRLFVTGASGIAESIGVHPFAVGALIVAIGTSLPELVTTLIARWRGHDEIGLGTLLGSNLMNGMAIVGVAASIHPIRAPLGGIAVTLAFGLVCVVAMLPYQGVVPRRRGLLLLALYGGFVAATLVMEAPGR